MGGIKRGNGLISEAGGIAATSVKKGGKALAGEAGKFAKNAYEQITGTQKGPPPRVEPNGEEKRRQEQVRIEQIQAVFKKAAGWRRAEKERIEKERERLAQVREGSLAAEEEEKEEKFGSLEWFKNIGKKAKGWAFKREKKEIKPAGFKG